jgi:hypothetical protein
MTRTILVVMSFVTIFLFIGVAFPHAQHTEIAGNCATCHHHSPKGATPACGECHEAITVFHYNPTSKEPNIGLKGAYHGQCMGCHKKMGGPLGCTDCHEKKGEK